MTEARLSSAEASDGSDLACWTLATLRSAEASLETTQSTSARGHARGQSTEAEHRGRAQRQSAKLSEYCYSAKTSPECPSHPSSFEVTVTKAIFQGSH